MRGCVRGACLRLESGRENGTNTFSCTGIPTCAHVCACVEECRDLRMPSSCKSMGVHVHQFVRKCALEHCLSVFTRAHVKCPTACIFYALNTARWLQSPPYCSRRYIDRGPQLLCPSTYAAARTVFGNKLRGLVNDRTDVRGWQDDADGLGLRGQLLHLLQVEAGCGGRGRGEREGGASE